MSHDNCIADGTVKSPLKKVIASILIGYIITFFIHPESFSAYAYMLPDSEIAYFLQDISETSVDAVKSLWETIGLDTPFNEIKNLKNEITGS